jgi:hypothetical protein
MKSHSAFLLIGRVVSLLLASVLCVQAQAPSLVSPGQVGHVVVVRDVKVRDAAVSGLIVNNSPRLVRDVKVIVRHTWLWKNERHPGDESPGRSEEFAVPGEAPPGGTLPFKYDLAAPLPARADGHFVTSAEVISFTEVGY